MSSPQTSQQIPDGTLIEGRYRVVRLMGTGGFGEIYRVLDEVLHRELVLKIPRVDLARSDAFRRAFLREARLAMELRSPGTVAVRSAGQVGSLPYFTMDLVPGRDLRQVLLEEGRVPVERALRLVIRLLEVLDEAHRRGIVHRDLKPANLMVVPAREAGEPEGIVLLDFGIARVLSATPGAQTLGLGRVVGSPQYMSPEQAAGDHVDARGDLYAVGVLLFEMLTGRPPFDAENTGRLLMKQITEAPPTIAQVAPDLPPWPALERALARAMAKDPRDRHPDARTLREDLERILEDPARDVELAAPTEERPVAAGPGVLEAANGAPAGPVSAPAEATLDEDAPRSRRFHARLARRRRRRVLRRLAAFVLFAAVLGVAGGLLYQNVLRDLQRTQRRPIPSSAAEFLLLDGAREIVTAASEVELRGRLLAPVPGALVTCDALEVAVDDEGHFALRIPSQPSREVVLACRTPDGARFEDRFAIVFDDEAPVLELLRPARDGEVTGSAVLDVAVRVRDATLAGVRCHPEGRPEAGIALLPEVEGGDTFHGTLPLAGDSNQRFAIEAVDRAEQFTRRRFAIVRDAQGPVLHLLEPREGAVACGSSVRVRIEAEDALSGVASTSVNGRAATTQDGRIHEVVVPIEGAAERVTLRIQGLDGVGNTTELIAEATVDARPPRLLERRPEEAAVLAPGRQVVLLRFDEPVQRARVDGRAVEVAGAELTFELSLAAPRQVVAVECEDACGNHASFELRFEVAREAPAERIEAVGDEAPMVWVPPGQFFLGEPNTIETHRKRHGRTPGIVVKFTEGFYVDQYEVTVRQYGAFLRAWRREDLPRVLAYEHPAQDPHWDHEPPDWLQQERHPERPVVNLAFWDAYAYARWVGRRLPTEYEWEYAARGASLRLGRRWPVGNDENQLALVNYARSFFEGPTDVGYFQRDLSPCGAVGMTGNVREWCSTAYDPDRYGALFERSPTGIVDPADPLVDLREPRVELVTRGGSYFDGAEDCEASMRRGELASTRLPLLGFRCVKSRGGSR